MLKVKQQMFSRPVRHSLDVQTDKTPPIYGGSVRLHDWKHTARTGMSVDFGIRDIGPKDIHPFKGMICGKEHGQRLKIWIGPSSDHLLIDESSDGHFYRGEALLMRWSDDSSGGMSIRMVIDAGPDGTDGKHPLDGFVTGRKEGEVLTFVSWAISDDETLQHPEHIRKKTPFVELTSVKQSQILCGDSRFISFLAKNEDLLLTTKVSLRPADDPKLYAAEFVRTYIGAESRAVMNYQNHQGAIARKKWAELMRYYHNERGLR